MRAVLREGVDLLVIPEPSYWLRFFGGNPELTRGLSAWKLFRDEEMSRIPRYQEKGDVANYEEADAYLRGYGL